MSNKIIFSLLGIVVVGGAVWFLTQGGLVSPTNTSGGKTSLAELLAVDEPQSCTFAHKVGGADSSGTVYVMKGKMRGDFASVTEGQNVKSHMIVDGETIYIWSDLMAQGMKMSLQDTQGGNGENQAVDLNQELDYSCNDWAVDPSFFTLPESITFQDLSSLMGGMMPQGVSGGGPGSSAYDEGAGNACASCDQLPEGSRAQCRTALKCQ